MRVDASRRQAIYYRRDDDASPFCRETDDCRISIQDGKMIHEKNVSRKLRAFSAAAVCTLMICMVGSAARAQGRRLDDRPTEGILLFGSGLLGPPEAWCGETNPAGLAFIRNWSLSLHHTEMDSRSGRGGTGSAFFWAQKIPWVPLAYGVTGQYLRWPDSFGPGYGEVGKLGFSLAWKISPIASVGMSVNHFIGPGSEGLDGMTTWEFSSLLRPVPHFALGMKISDVFMPKWWNGLPLQRTWDLEAGWRPMGDSRLTLMLGARLGERRSTADPRFGLEWRLWRGIFLRGELEYRYRKIPTDGPADGIQDVNDFRAVFGLAVNFSNWGAGMGAAFGSARAGLDRSVFSGAGGWVRISGADTPSVYQRGDKAVVLRVPPPSASEKAFLSFVLDAERSIRNRKVAAVIVSISDEGAGWARAQEVRDLVKRMRKKGKKTAAVVKTPGNNAYYIATAADNVWLDPSGGLMISGMSVSRLYYRKLLERLGVRVQFVKHGGYKTAPETFDREGPSSEAEEVSSEILKETYGEWIRALSARGALKSERYVKKKMKQVPFTPGEALKLGFADDTIYEDEVNEKLRKLVGRSVRLIPAGDPVRRDHEWGRRNAIAVLIVEGDIVSGRSRRIPFLNRYTAGDETLIRVIRRLRASPRIKAVVIRIDSPGGSATASSRIRRELAKLGEVKPVIASLSNAAASGGYELASAAGSIFAQRSTLTGSIGIFAGKPDVSTLMEKLGVGIHMWEEGPFAGLKSNFVPFTPEQKKMLEKKLHEHYMRFVKSVAEGRENMNEEEVEKAAKGRVWTGLQAKDLGLVDHIGGLSDAMAEARRKANLPVDSPVLVYPEEPKGLIAKLTGGIVGTGPKNAGMDSDVKWSPLSPAYGILKTIPPSFLFAHDDMFFTRMPYDLLIR